MTYESIEDIPQTLREVLPKEALEIYLEAYNQAWDEYDERMGGQDLERAGVAHRDAMHAVREKYVLDEEADEWVEKEEFERRRRERAKEEEEGGGVVEEIQDQLEDMT